MELAEMLKILLPLGGIFGSIGWKLYSKVDKRIDKIEETQNKIDKDAVEVKTGLKADIKYILEDIREIKEILKK